MYITFAIIIMCSTETFALKPNETYPNAGENLKKVFKTLIQSISSIELPDFNFDPTTNSSQLIKKYGFKAEEHIVNANGYLLTLFRIPSRGPPVFIFHGLFTTSDDFLTLGSTSLPIYLASLGYDVWLGNSRGTTYSRKHVTLSPRNPKFWDFSYNEIGTEDAPSFIDYICKATGAPRITYIGYSQGTTSAYVLLSEKPEYNKKLLGVISLASVSYMSRAKSPGLQILLAFGTELEAALKSLNINEVVPHRPPFSTLLALSASSKILTFIFLTLSYVIVGFDYYQIDFEKTKEQIIHIGTGNSVKQIAHFGQNFKSGLFQKYDYGAHQNKNRYGSEIAPSYKIERITVNMSIVYGDNDLLSSYDDVRQFMSRLPTPPEVYRVNHTFWNHVDYIWAKDADKLLYHRVGEMVKRYNS